jgi:aspartate/methionine/tyrosine aminotransferase
MRLADFKLEQWLNPKDPIAKYNLGASCVKALQVENLFDMIGEDINVFFNDELRKMSLHYGHFYGMERLLNALSKLYINVDPKSILTVHGGTGANNMAITELLELGDNVVAFLPNYQQHYSIPESLGAEVRCLMLREENKYLPDINELCELVDEKTKLITLSNPNNPTGSFIQKDLLNEIVEIAKSVGAFILSDEIYRGLADEYMTSIVDLYDKGIATSSMSKVFSMAGTRLGWLIIKDIETYKRFENRRSYDTVCCGPFDELITAIAMEHFEKILERSRNIVRTNRRIFDEWIIKQSHLSCSNESFSTTAFITYDYDIPTEEFCTDLFEKTSVLLCHGECFNIPKSFRLGYGFGQPEHFKEGLKLLGEYLDTLK